MAINPKYVNTQLPMVYRSNYVPNWGDPFNTLNPNAATIESASKGAGLKGWFGNHFGPGKALFGSSSGTTGNFIDNAKSLRSNVLGTELFKGGPTFAQTANIANAGIQGMQAVQGFSNVESSKASNKSLKQDIVNSMAANPMAMSSLNAEEEALLRKMKSGGLDSKSTSGIAQGIGSSIPKALLNAGLGFLTGNIPGALIGGLGTLANGGISGYNDSLNENNAKLQGLYAKLRNSEEEYNQMRRPAGLARAGLQSRYYNQLY